MSNNVSVSRELLTNIKACLEQVYDSSYVYEYNSNGADRYLCPCCQSDFGDSGTQEHEPKCAKMASFDLISEIANILGVDNGPTK